MRPIPLAMLTVVPLAGCAGLVAGDSAERPVLLAMSTDHITVGQPLDFYGGAFYNATDSGHSEVRFKGEFKSDSGKTYAVDQRVRTNWSDGNHIVWPFVGPYSNPFVPKDGDQLGTFTGQLTAINVAGGDNSDSHEEAESGPIDVTLTFEPGIIVRDMQPVAATCDEPAKRMLGGFAYKLEVEAVGFTPVNFTYLIGGESRTALPRVFRQLATGNVDHFGDAGELVIAPVPDGEPFYLAGIGIGSLGTDGIQREMHLTIGVHRPIEYIDSGEVAIAQIEPAKPDSGCLSGGQTTGSTVTYQETVTETRTRTLGLTWDESWLSSISNMQGGSHTTTNSINWSVSHTDMEGWGFGWDASASVSAGAKASIFGLAEGSLTTTVTGGIRNDHNWGYSDSRSVGGDHSESDTESWATTQTTSHNVAQGSSDFWAVSSADSKSLAFTGLVLPGQYGVFYRQVTRTAIPGKIVAYNLCGNAEVVADASFFDYQWSLELAQGPTCNPLPECHLPEAACILAPCGTAP